jgi:hypothetical protein
MPWFNLEINGLLAGIIAIVAGVLVIAFPRILNYLIGIYMLAFGILWMWDGAWLPGILSLLFGIVVMIFPAILNYLVATYLVLLGLWLIFGVEAALIVGIVTLVFGVVVLIFPAILNTSSVYIWWWRAYWL